MTKFRRVLVGVKDPLSRSSAAIAKGAELARATGASLELFHAITAVIPAESFTYGKRRLGDVEREVRARQLAALERSARRLRANGLRVSVAADWDFPSHEAIVRRAIRTKADIIVAGQHQGWRTLPWLLHLTDWELLRLSPVPVLLVKSSRAYRRPVVLAALDPAHAFAKSARLDEEILEAAGMVTDALGGTLHAMHAYFTGPGIPMSPEFSGTDVLAQVSIEAEREASESLARELRNRNIARSRQHLVERQAIDAIPRVARQVRAAIVVMGAVSRSGLRRAFIGNTAERVLDRLSCDVLVVRPPKFHSSILRARRGVRIVTTVPPPPY
jgi:universal stress protein E